MRRRVVDPVVGSLISPDELERATLRVHEGFVMVDVVARGETCSAYLGEVDDSRWDAEGVAEHLHDSLSGDLPTMGFAWGEERTGRYVVPE